jgi:hypothetical protein
MYDLIPDHLRVQPGDIIVDVDNSLGAGNMQQLLKVQNTITGTFGIVYKAKLWQENNGFNIVAVKTLKNSKKKNSLGKLTRPDTRRIDRLRALS